MMVGLTNDTTRQSEKGDLIVVLPGHRVLLVEAKALCYAQVGIEDITPDPRELHIGPPWWEFVLPPEKHYVIRLEGEMKGYTLMKTGSLKRVLRYLEKRKREKHHEGDRRG